jgi:putative transposase
MERMVERLVKRKNPRLRGYEYSLAGGYFVTICASRRGDVFGVVDEGEVVLNDIGKMVQQCWHEIPERFPSVELDTFILMPDHFHAVTFLLGTNVRAGLDPARNRGTDQPSTQRATSRVAPTLGRIIGSFKSISTNRYFSGVNNQGWPLIGKKLWQRGYYDRIIRDEDELNHIRHYITYNAIKQAVPDFTSEANYEART